VITSGATDFQTVVSYNVPAGSAITINANITGRQQNQLKSSTYVYTYSAFWDGGSNSFSDELRTVFLQPNGGLVGSGPDPVHSFSGGTFVVQVAGGDLSNPVDWTCVWYVFQAP
jgi:hypothetical protein